eukprot:5621959-Amphidinium_carterae.1
MSGCVVLELRGGGGGTISIIFGPYELRLQIGFQIPWTWTECIRMSTERCIGPKERDCNYSPNRNVTV